MNSVRLTSYITKQEGQVHEKVKTLTLNACVFIYNDNCRNIRNVKDCKDDGSTNKINERYFDI